MSDLVHISNSLTCPGIDFNPGRDTHDAMESIDYLWTLLTDFGYQHCIFGCIGCLERMDKDNKKHLPSEPPGNYRSAFATLHDALAQLPENLFRHLSDISNGDCPACAVLTALQQFSTIARYSEHAPIGWNALPCYLEEAMDDWGNYFSDSTRHIKALRNLDLSKLPSRMPPAERRDVKAKIMQGKAIVEFVRGFLDGDTILPPTMSDDELWAVLACSDQIRTLNENNLFVSPRWKHWAKESILNGDNGSKGAFVSRVGLVAFDCHRNIQEARDNAHFGMWMPEVSEYGVILSILTAAYFYSSGVALTEQGSDVWFEKATQGLIVFERDDFGKRYYGLSALGSALALRHGGSPPPFLQQEAERNADPVPPPVTITTTDVIDNDLTASSNAQAAATGGKGGDGGEATVAFGKDAIKQVNNQTVNVPPPDLSPMAEFARTDAEKEKIKQDAETERLRLVLDRIVPPPPESTDAPKKGKAQRGRPSDSDKERDARHVAGWERYRENGQSKQQYVDDNPDIKATAELDRILDRHRSQKRSE